MEEKANIAAEGKEEVFSREDYKRIVENLLFITDRTLSAAKLSQVAQINNIQLTKDIVNALAQEYAQSGRAIQIVELGGGFQMSTKPEYGRWVRALFNEKSSDKLSPAALETLAIIAYKQPVTRAEIEAIRGVDIVGPLEKIMERGLVRVVGRKDAPGKPMVYGTTDEFLRVFGLNHISQLPELKTFESKGPREIQSDLPFGPSLPQVKEAILPLEEEAKDIVQEVFMNLWENHLFLKVRNEALKTYLFRAVRNTCLNRLKKKDIVCDRLDDIREDIEETETRILNEDLIDEIKKEIAAMPDQTREIITGIYFLNLKYQEVADRLGISLNTVKTLLRTGLVHLRKQFGSRTDLFLALVIAHQID